jgi:hypothetical protein
MNGIERYWEGSTPLTFLGQPDGTQIRLDLTAAQIEEFHRRGADIRPRNGGGLLIRLD